MKKYYTEFCHSLWKLYILLEASIKRSRGYMFNSFVLRFFGLMDGFWCSCSIKVWSESPNGIFALSLLSRNLILVLTNIWLITWLKASEGQIIRLEYIRESDWKLSLIITVGVLGFSSCLSPVLGLHTFSLFSFAFFSTLKYFRLLLGHFLTCWVTLKLASFAQIYIYSYCPLLPFDSNRNTNHSRNVFPSLLSVGVPVHLCQYSFLVVHLLISLLCVSWF